MRMEIHDHDIIKMMYGAVLIHCQNDITTKFYWDVKKETLVAEKNTMKQKEILLFGNDIVGFKNYLNSFNNCNADIEVLIKWDDSAYKVANYEQVLKAITKTNDRKIA